MRTVFYLGVRNVLLAEKEIDIIGTRKICFKPLAVARLQRGLLKAFEEFKDTGNGQELKRQSPLPFQNCKVSSLPSLDSEEGWRL
jgi:hypothetical protein